MDYVALAVTATKLISEFGVEMTLRSASAADVYDPVTGEITPTGAATDTVVRGVLVTPTAEYSQSIGGNIEAQDMLIYLETKVYPNLSDVLVFTSDTIIETWNIVNVQEIRPASVPLLYIVQVRP